MNIARIHHVLERKRWQHPELRQRCGARELRSVIAREDVGLFYLPMATRAKAMWFPGSVAIALSTRAPRPRGRKLAELLAHELAHVWLHIHAAESGRRDPERDSPREEIEADYLAAMICEGISG